MCVVFLGVCHREYALAEKREIERRKVELAFQGDGYTTVPNPFSFWDFGDIHTYLPSVICLFLFVKNYFI